jgi:hypothetical protein
VVLLLGRDLVSWSLGIDERGGHEDLRGSDRQSVIPYVHGRTGLYCSSLPCLYESEPFLFPTDQFAFFFHLLPCPTLTFSVMLNTRAILLYPLRIDCEGGIFK